MKSILPIIIRMMTEEDKNFVYSSWIKNMYDSLPYKLMTWHTFCSNKSEEILDIFTVSNTVVACLADDPETVLGWLTYSHMHDQLIVHYAYVKQSFRGNKIMLDLLESADANYKNQLIVVTNINQVYQHLQKKFNITYNPYLTKILMQIKKDTQ